MGKRRRKIRDGTRTKSSDPLGVLIQAREDAKLKDRASDIDSNRGKSKKNKNGPLNAQKKIKDRMWRRYCRRGQKPQHGRNAKTLTV